MVEQPSKKGNLVKWVVPGKLKAWKGIAVKPNNSIWRSEIKWFDGNNEKTNFCHFSEMLPNPKIGNELTYYGFKISTNFYGRNVFGN